MGDKFKHSKDYGVSVIFKGRKLDADVDISGIFTMKFVNKVGLYFSKKNDMIHKSFLKTIEPVRETSQKNLLIWGEKMTNVRKSVLLTNIYYLMLRM